MAFIAMQSGLCLQLLVPSLTTHTTAFSHALPWSVCLIFVFLLFAIKWLCFCFIFNSSCLYIYMYVHTCVSLCIYMYVAFAMTCLICFLFFLAAYKVCLGFLDFVLMFIYFLMNRLKVVSMCAKLLLFYASYMNCMLKRGNTHTGFV